MNARLFTDNLKNAIAKQKRFAKELSSEEECIMHLLKNQVLKPPKPHK